METLYHLDEVLAYGIEVVATAVVVFASASAAWRLFIPRLLRADRISRKEIWRNFASWLVIGLEFMLAADLVRTAVSPTWNQIAQLGAIAAIRTFLNYFLEVDIRKSQEARDVRSLREAA